MRSYSTKTHIYPGGLMEDLDNKWILNASISQDCKEKDGNNPVTLGLENMRGVRISSFT